MTLINVLSMFHFYIAISTIYTVELNLHHHKKK
jgi:hypothetical protein